MADSSVSFANQLNFNVTVYDSFSDKDTTNYFGTLTLLATVPANTTVSVQLPHPAASVLIVYNATTNVPLARRIFAQGLITGPLSVAQADVDAMAQTMDFIAFIIKNPNDALATAFQALWKDGSKPQVSLVNQFFAQHPPYASCTFATYMMGITYTAAQPASKGQPPDQALYSLTTLLPLLGGTWPPEMPDIVVTKFTCDTQNDVLAIRAEIDLKKLPAQSDQALQFFGSLFDVQKLQVAFMFNYGLDLGVLGTRLSIGLDAVHVPFGGTQTLTINKPTATIDINPLFKFVVFTVTGAIPFQVFGKTFEADVAMLIDNIEASFGVTIKGDDSSLPAPPVMKGVHFDEFAVGIGVIFEPPGAAIGLSGKLHIGELSAGTQTALADDQFALVCQLVDGVPNPLFISFYVPHMQLTDVIRVFTDAAQSPLDVPVLVTDLSFQWSENPMEPVALPDGSLSSMGYGFSATVQIAEFSFHGDLHLDLNDGVSADVEMAPLQLGSVFSLAGDGRGVSIKVDAIGNPIKNNLLVTTAARQQALKDTTMQQLVPAGGPVLKIQTSASPFLHVDALVSLFELNLIRLAANITSSGISFELDYGVVLSSNMSCTLADWHNLAAQFQFGIDRSISLPSVNGVSLGYLPLQALASVHFSLNTSTSDLVFAVGGSFNFEGKDYTFGDFTADAHIQQVSDLLEAIVRNIEDSAGQLFDELLNTGAAWASQVKQGIIAAADPVATVLHQAFGQDATQVAATMRDAGYAVDTVASELKQVFDLGQIAQALKDVFGLPLASVAQTLQQAGYAGEEVAGALKSAFGDDAGSIASVLQSVFGWGVDQTQSTLGQIGFGANQIGQAFQNLGGDFAHAGRSILDSLNPFKK